MNDSIINFNEDKQDQIDRYLKGEMSEQECSIFEQTLIDDKILNDQFVYSKLVKEVISSRSAKLAKISQWENLALQNNSVSLLNTMRAHRLWPYRWVASILLVFSLGIFGINYLLDVLYNVDDVNQSEPTYNKNIAPQDNSQSDSIVIDSLTVTPDSIIYKK